MRYISLVMKLIIKYPHPSLDLTFWLLLSCSVACLLIFLTLSFTEQKFFISIKTNLSIILLGPLMLYLKSHHHTQHHLDFLWYLLGVL